MKEPENDGALKTGNHAELMKLKCPPTLSKSRFMSGLQCELKLWNEAFRRDLATPSVEQQAIFDVGTAIGKIAQQRWPGGMEVAYKPWERHPAVTQTQKLMADTSVPAIYEAAFLAHNLYVRVDILARAADGWDLIEVKSSTHPEKGVFLQDLSVQYWVLQQLDILVRQAGILVIDNTYVYPGGDYEPSQLFRFHEATEQCRERADWVAREIERLHRVLTLEHPPDIPIGDHCFRPYDCPYYGHCSAGLPSSEHPISDLYRLNSADREKLSQLGVETIPDIPDDFPLNRIQARMRKTVRIGQPWQSPALREQLEAIQWPLYYLDFEAWSPALPRYVGTRPYQAIPFQYSLHIEHQTGGMLKHHEYLHTEATDPRSELIDALLTDIGKTGSIIVYSGYERRIFAELAAQFPDHEATLSAVADRLFDLLPIIRQHYYHPSFRGSFSIKSVLPAVVQKDPWSNLQIDSGLLAAVRYEQAITSTDAAFRETTFSDLRKYCAEDTNAMVLLRRALLK